MDMFIKNHKLLAQMVLVTGLSGAFLHGNLVSAQDETLDFHGIINESNHPPGYVDYVKHGCWQCHGFQGSAGREIVAPLMPYEVFATQVRKPYGVMPAYSVNVLSDEQLKRIYGYLQQLPPGQEVSTIPLLSGD